jgi:biotin synthase
VVEYRKIYDSALKTADLRFQDLSTWQLISLANEERDRQTGTRFELCSITNAKSGRCSEDCKFCAQSAHYNTNAPVFRLKSKEELLEEAHKAKDIGAERFSIVTSGKGATPKEIETIAEVVSAIKEKIGIIPCASLGVLDTKSLGLLKDAGLSRYHHNIETSREFYPEIVTTHTFEDRLKTIRAAKEVGLEVCSGGIIGLGESEEDRIRMALTLKDLEVDSVPINILVPLKGTPFDGAQAISIADILRTIAIFRLILGDKTIRIVAGRESVLKDFQGLAFMAGANGMMIGGYLTVKGRSAEDDLAMVSELKKLWNG